MRIGYARVSTQEQDTHAQISALREAGCELIFQEKASGGRWNRPEFRRLLELSPHRQREIVTLVMSGQKSGANVARLFCVHPSTIVRLLAKSEMTAKKIA